MAFSGQLFTSYFTIFMFPSTWQQKPTPRPRQVSSDMSYKETEHREHIAYSDLDIPAWESLEDSSKSEVLSSTWAVIKRVGMIQHLDRIAQRPSSFFPHQILNYISLVWVHSSSWLCGVNLEEKYSNCDWII